MFKHFLITLSAFFSTSAYTIQPSTQLKTPQVSNFEAGRGIGVQIMLEQNLLKPCGLSSKKLSFCHFFQSLQELAAIKTNGKQPFAGLVYDQLGLLLLAASSKPKTAQQKRAACQQAHRNLKLFEQALLAQAKAEGLEPEHFAQIKDAFTPVRKVCRHQYFLLSSILHSSFVYKGVGLMALCSAAVLNKALIFGFTSSQANKFKQRLYTGADQWLAQQITNFDPYADSNSFPQARVAFANKKSELAPKVKDSAQAKAAELSPELQNKLDVALAARIAQLTQGLQAPTRAAADPSLPATQQALTALWPTLDEALATQLTSQGPSESKLPATTGILKSQAIAIKEQHLPDVVAKGIRGALPSWGRQKAQANGAASDTASQADSTGGWRFFGWGGNA